MHFTVGSAIRDWYRPGAMGNDSAKAGCQDRSDLSKDSLLLLPFFPLCPPNAQVIDRVVSAKDFSPRSRPWYLRSLLSLVFVFSLSRKGRRSCQLVRLTPSREWIIEIKSSGGLATRNDIGAGLAVGCHNIVPRLAAIVRPFDSFHLFPSLSDKGYRYWSLEGRIGQTKSKTK